MNKGTQMQKENEIKDVFITDWILLDDFADNYQGLISPVSALSVYAELKEYKMPNFIRKRENEQIFISPTLFFLCMTLFRKKMNDFACSIGEVINLDRLAKTSPKKIRTIIKDIDEGTKSQFLSEFGYSTDEKEKQ